MNIATKIRGFTLIELLVVISIIGLLSGVIIKSLNNARSNARNVVRLENAEAIVKAFQIAITGVNGNQLPSSEGNFVCLGAILCNGNGDSPLVDSVLNDGLAGRKAPIDTFFPIDPIAGPVGFTYVSNYVPLFSPPFTVPQPNPPPPRGAYLLWMMEGPKSSISCGKGFVWIENSYSYVCFCISILQSVPVHNKYQESCGYACLDTYLKKVY